MAALAGKPDIVFTRQKVAVFCDGDFFHGRDWRDLHEKLQRRANATYWISKIEYNRSRDQEVTQILEMNGWRVLRFWESEIRTNVDRVADEIESAVIGVSQ